MRWRKRQQSTNVDDRRGRPVGRGVAIGGVGTVVLMIIIFALGGNPLAVLNQGGGGQPQGGGEPRQPSPEEEELKKFVSTVLRDTEVVWGEQLKAQTGRDYKLPELVLFTQNVRSGCGLASSGVGPFYCPADQKVYIDLGFFEELKTKFGAPGDFAIAYVLAHEVGHHVQHLNGDTARAHEHGQRVGESENETSVRIELQADFYAGIWAHHGQQQFDFLESGDLQEAMRAAEVVGDDAIQKKMQGRVTPDSFTHGTSEQRMKWFMRGFRSGRMADGDPLMTLPYQDL